MSQRLYEQTFYEILEVAPNATQQDIYAAYHRAKATYSPDSPALYSMFTREEARELMNLIEEAFSTLCDQSRRREYDMLLIQRHQGFHPESLAASAQPGLPDFKLPDGHDHPDKAHRKVVPSASPVKPPAPAKKESLPEGFARTRMSVYEVDPAMEAEIQQQTLFDGPFLLKVRQYKKVNLDQLSEGTKISRPYITALESNDYDALPAPVFVRGFVVQLAKVYALNEKLVADSYMSLLRKAKG
ncbi:MAG: helix-turn-helix domain-containing protein [Bdellovibrionales bacterium]|nr:helix-turn-helix domain-containing protein [Bdellovibrionales bacterium]